MTILLNGFARAQRGALRTIGLGDSITASDSAVSANGLWHESNGIFESTIRANTSRHPFTFVRNAGVAGNTTPDMLARLDTDVLAYNPDVVFITSGTNDIVSGAVDADYVTWLNALETIVVRLLCAGIEPILFTPPAKDAAPAEMRRAIPFVYMLAKFYGLTLIDAFAVTADPVTGQYLSGYSSDGTHPNKVGIAAIVAAAGLPLDGYAASYKAVVSETSTGNIANMIRNGTFQKSTTPPTPDGWTVNLTGAAASITGGGWQYTKSSGTGVYALFGSGISTGYAVGDVLEFNGALEVSGLPGSPNGYTAQLDWNSDSVTPVNTRIVNDVMEFSTEIIVPAGFGGTAITPQLFVQDNGVYFVSNWTLWNKSAYSAVWKPGALL
jgi:lysophospholipase L1-like esterase